MIAIGKEWQLLRSMSLTQEFLSFQARYVTNTRLRLVYSLSRKSLFYVIVIKERIEEHSWQFNENV